MYMYVLLHGMHGDLCENKDPDGIKDHDHETHSNKLLSWLESKTRRGAHGDPGNWKTFSRDPGIISRR